MNKHIVFENNGYIFLQGQSQEYNQHYNPDVYWNEKGENKTEAISRVEAWYRYYYLTYRSYISTEWKSVIVPDKSVICRKDSRVFRLVDHWLSTSQYQSMHSKINLYKELTPEDYWKTDSYINFRGARKIVSALLKEIFGTFTEDIWKEYTKTIILPYRQGDLLSEWKWKGLDINCRHKYVDRNAQEVFMQKNQYENKIGNLPLHLRFIKGRPSRWYRNKRLTKERKTCLILGGSTVHDYIIPYLAPFFEETLFLWDHGRAMPEILSFLCPDVIIQMHTERFYASSMAPLTIDLCVYILLDMM